MRGIVEEIDVGVGIEIEIEIEIEIVEEIEAIEGFDGKRDLA